MILGSVLTAKEHVEMFQERMDEEINRLWQRSIFLATFLVLVFTGYGMLVSKFFDSDFNSEESLLLHLVCIGISTIGIILSLLWIMMAKGSKAWQEKYERSLFKFIEREINAGDLRVSYPLKNGLGNGYLSSIEDDKFSNCLFSTNAGAYSPSRVNVMVGIVSLIVWAIILPIHISILMKVNIWCIVLFLIIFMILLFGVIMLCRSGVIQDAQNNISKKWHSKLGFLMPLCSIIFIVIIGAFSFWISSIIKNNFFDDKNDNAGNLWIEMKTLIIK